MNKIVFLMFVLFFSLNLCGQPKMSHVQELSMVYSINHKKLFANNTGFEYVFFHINKSVFQDSVALNSIHYWEWVDSLTAYQLINNTEFLYNEIGQLCEILVLEGVDTISQTEINWSVDSISVLKTETGSKIKSIYYLEEGKPILVTSWKLFTINWNLFESEQFSYYPNEKVKEYKKSIYTNGLDSVVKHSLFQYNSEGVEFIYNLLEQNDHIYCTLISDTHLKMMPAVGSPIELFSTVHFNNNTGYQGGEGASSIPFEEHASFNTIYNDDDLLERCVKRDIRPPYSYLEPKIIWKKEYFWSKKNTLSIQNKLIEKLIIVPNPIVSIFQFKNHKFSSISQIIIYNQLGQQVQQNQLTSNEVDASHLHTGIYYYSITEDDEMKYTGRFIKQ